MFMENDSFLEQIVNLMSSHSSRKSVHPVRSALRMIVQISTDIKNLSEIASLN